MVLSKSMHRALIARGLGWLTVGDLTVMGSHLVIGLCMSGKGVA
jgi:hypothetical protein